jgi:hypothetical protein
MRIKPAHRKNVAPRIADRQKAAKKKTCEAGSNEAKNEKEAQRSRAAHRKS